MVDFIPSITPAIETATGLNCYLELSDTKKEIPCITIIQSSNAGRQQGNNIKYSYPIYTIKVYSDSYAELTDYCDKTDIAMFQLGYKLEGSNTIKNDIHLCRVLNYGWLAEEKIQETN